MDKAKAFVKKNGDKWCVYSHSGEQLSCYDTEEKAHKRLKEIEFFKHQGGSIERKFFCQGFARCN